MQIGLGHEGIAASRAGGLVDMRGAGFARSSLLPLRRTMRPSMSQQLFASTCGWCHSDGGRAVGKGPQLMDSPRDDDYIRNRIKTGKEGAMPAFGAAFSDAQIDEIIKYIRSLKPRQG